MPKRPDIFISATSGDLASIRTLVKNALLSINCHPIEQSHFGPDWRDVDKMLRGKIENCQALIHIVGMRYGAEPDPASLPKGAPRRSFTQMEYHLGRALQNKRGDHRFRVYTFVCPEDFPFDVEPDVESDDKRELQRLHRAAILAGTPIYYQPADKVELEKLILALREEVLALREEQKSLFSALTGLDKKLGKIITATETIKKQNQQQDEKLDDARAMLAEIISNTSQQNNHSQAFTPQQRYNMALQEVAFKHDLQPEELSKAINAWTEAVKADPQASPYDLALAEYKANHFDKAAEQASIAYDEAMQAREQATGEAIKAAHLEGDAYEAVAKYELALAAYRKAAALLNKAQQPLLWAEEQNMVALMLDYLARYGEAEPIYKEILAIREQQQGANHTDTAVVLNNLASLLQATNRLSEAEPLMRQALAIDETSFGKDHSKVAGDLNNLASLLQDTSRLDEAEPLMRRALVIDENNFGIGHPYVARDLNNFATLLQATNRLGEAEPLMRRALAIDEDSFGSDHPKVAIRLNNLATLLLDTNRLDEAEPLMRRALAIDEDSFGFDHPDVAIDLNNLASLLKSTNRLGEAEPLMHRHLLIFLQFTNNTGHQHPHLLAAINNYQNLLTAMQLSQTDINQRLQILANEAGFSPPQWQALQTQCQGK